MEWQRKIATAGTGHSRDRRGGKARQVEKRKHPYFRQGALGRCEVYSSLFKGLGKLRTGSCGGSGGAVSSSRGLRSQPLSAG